MHIMVYMHHDEIPPDHNLLNFSAKLIFFTKHSCKKIYFLKHAESYINVCLEYTIIRFYVILNLPVCRQAGFRILLSIT